MKALTIVR